MIIKTYIGGLLLSLFIWCESAAGSELAWYTAGVAGSVSGIEANVTLEPGYSAGSRAFPLLAQISARQLCTNTKGTLIDSYRLGASVKGYYSVGMVLGLYGDVDVCLADDTTCQTLSGYLSSGSGYTLIEYNGTPYYSSWYAETKSYSIALNGGTTCSFFPSDGYIGIALTDIGTLIPGRYNYHFILNGGRYTTRDSAYYSSFSDIGLSRAVEVALTNQYLVTVSGTLNVINSCVSNTNELVFDVGSISATSLPVEAQKDITISCGYQSTGTIKLLGVSDGKIDMEGGIQAGIRVVLNNNVLSLNESDAEIKLFQGANALTIIATVMRSENEDITAGEHTGSAVLQITYS